ncbi:DNA-binding protein [Micromonospora chalcea]|uniref:DNA-binding protein n=1 Tax=Micromonospora chalcea TaxID=1874 RepID=UPI0034564F11
MNVTVPTPEEIRGWPATVSVVDAGRCFGAGRDLSYDLARQGAFPCPVLRLGRRLVVTRAALLQALGEDTKATDGGAP